MSEDTTVRRGDALASRLHRLVSRIRAAWLDASIPPATPRLRDYPFPVSRHPSTASFESRKKPCSPSHT
jgi:hypothetical protein